MRYSITIPVTVGIVAQPISLVVPRLAARFALAA